MHCIIYSNSTLNAKCKIELKEMFIVSIAVLRSKPICVSRRMEELVNYLSLYICCNTNIVDCCGVHDVLVS